jgi:hypothetical protein
MAIAGALSSAINCTVEGFEATQQSKNPGYSLPKSWINFAVFLILVILVAAFGKVLWNDVLAKFITVIKPLPDIWHVMAMYVAIDIFFGGR